jgi:uncharacterized protein
MDFEWDKAKSEACFFERGFDFAYVAQAFFDPHRLNRADLRRNYGEERYQLLGRIDSRIFVVVYTLRSKATRIISARKANNREINQYENSSHQN